MQALVVVDYQNDFVTGSMGFAGAEKLEPVILRKIDDYRKKGGAVIFTLDTHEKDYSTTAEGDFFPPHCIKGSFGEQLYGKVAKAVNPEDTLIYKHSYGSLELGYLLREKGYESVELCGLVTDICVLSNGVIARTALPESRIIVDSRACAGGDISAHKRGLETMRGLRIDII